jgi:DNA polymerase III gamma/tau subunit
MLYQKYRPVKFDDIVGQEKAVKVARRIIERPGFDRGAFWIEASGANNSGVGKSSLANVIAHVRANDFFITEIDGGKCDKR